jgi:DNA invertase Pin-like site-specific DNA recombinase
MGQMFYAMLGVFAEFEYHLRRERQVEGIARAKAAGRYKGRKPLDATRIAEIRRMRTTGLRPVDIARQLRIGRTSVYKYLDGIRPAAEQPAA